MQHLSGFDASFLYSQTPHVHAHTLKALVFDLPDTHGEGLLEYVSERVEAQTQHLHALRMKPVEIPFGLGHPVWRTVDVEVADHVSFRQLEPGPRAREEAIGEFMSIPLVRDRPLWQLLALEDRERGELVLALKIHHAITDGNAAGRLLEIAAGVAEADEAEPIEPLSSRRLMLAGLVHSLRALLGLGGLLRETAEGMREVFAQRARLSAGLALPFTSPRVHFVRPVSARRALAFLSVPFEETRRVADHFGVTVNDVVLYLVASALRRHLKRRGEPVTRALVGALPVGIDPTPYAHGNHLSNILVPIHVEVDDPRERMRRSAESATAAKALHAAAGEQLLTGWTELSTPMALGAFWRFVRLSGRATAALIVSNVAGPREELELHMGPLKDIYSVGPLLETTGLNLTFWTYNGRLNGCVLMCPDHGSDPQQLAEDLQAELREILVSCEAASPRMDAASA